ncbi:MAG: molybdopterin-dependent oxidoreductase [SAR324 cluster bacterium]|nr:molybdopterin-dependent oxidoreductase [SAR324 cluster bacterium]
MPTFYLDDNPIEFEPGEKVLAAALRSGFHIPHYCYHPALSIVATCRMCLVDVVDMGNGRPAPKLMTSCSMDPADGMKIETKNEKVKEARELVMEFLLVNHPLDCPICDQAGECTLQDFSFEYGSGSSEMEYSKRVYGWRDIGTFVMLERNRCIHCTRCHRFTTEVTGTHEFGTFNRSHQLTVDTFTDRPMTNKFQGNMADICPVGCITEREFRFKRRAWKLQKTNSICTHCSTGCNITVEQDQNTVFRLKPRENQEVNQWWMCDDGRVSLRQFNNKKNRIMQPMGRVQGTLVKASWEQIYEAIKDKVKQLAVKKDEVVAITDTHASNEELFLLKKLLHDVFSSEHVFFPLRLWAQPDSPNFIDTLITTDKSPNTAGAIALGIKGNEDDSALKQVLSEKTKLAFVLGNPLGKESEIYDLVSKADLIICIGTVLNEWAERADVLLPGSTPVEKEGTFINKNHRVQKINAAVKAPRHAKADWLILQELIQSLGKQSTFQSTSEIFNSLATTLETFQGLTFEDVGDLGCSLPAT